MAFSHGKDVRVAFEGNNATSYFNEASPAATQEVADTTVFGKSNHTYIVGQGDGTVSLGGFWDGAANAIDSIMNSSFGTEDGGHFMVLPAGDASGVGSRAVFGKGELTSYEISNPVGDVVGISAEIQADDGVHHGVYLREAGSGTAFETVAGASADDAGPSHDNSASSANGGVAQLHVANNTLDGALDVKIQHSADDVTFADLVAFTQVGAGNEAAEQKTVTGTVNRYIRSYVAEAGTTGSAEVAVSFKRD